MEFQNGQNQYIDAFGYIEVTRPSCRLVYGDPLDPMRFFTISTEYLNLYNKLKLGDENDVGAMKYDIDVTCDFPASEFREEIAVLNITQTIENYNCPGFGYPIHHYLDGGKFYNGTASTLHGNARTGLGRGLVSFTDGPSVSTKWWLGNSYLQANFKAYIIMKPTIGNADENIWVTLGVVNWECNGIANFNTSTILNNVHPDPIINNDNDFPFYEGIHPLP